MHEQWKKRKMFSNREQGIMSGLDPVPMMGGGYVPYPGMQVGGVVPQPQLFEEGDAEVNDALNMMASVAKPDVPDMPMPMMDEKVEVREEVTEDQGPSNFKAAVTDLKNTFTKEIDNYIEKAGSENIGKYLKSMSVAYNNQLNNLRKQFKVDKIDPEDQLFTEEFLAEFMTDIPAYKHGGVHLDQAQLDELFGEGRFPLSEWNKYSPDIQEFLLRKSQIAKLEQDAASMTPQVDLSKLEALQAERRGLAKQAGDVASSAFATTGSAAGEFLGKRAAGKAAELGAMDTALADEIAVAKALVNAQAKGDIPSGLDIGFSAKEAEAFSLEEITKQKEERELLQDQWDEAVKAQDGKFGKALQLFINQTGGKLPPAYQDQRRAIPGTGDTGKLLDYYKILLGKEKEARETNDKSFYLPDELNKWITFPVV